VSFYTRITCIHITHFAEIYGSFCGHVGLFCVKTGLFCGLVTFSNSHHCLPHTLRKYRTHW